MTISEIADNLIKYASDCVDSGTTIKALKSRKETARPEIFMDIINMLTDNYNSTHKYTCKTFTQYLSVINKELLSRLHESSLDDNIDSSEDQSNIEAHSNLVLECINFVQFDMYNLVSIQAFQEDKKGNYTLDPVLEEINNVTVAKLSHNIRNAEREGIVDSRGVFYISNRSHFDLVQLLIAMGVDLRGAIRINNDSANKCLSLSSLYEFDKLDPEFRNDIVVYLTKRQAETIYAFIDEINKTKHNGKYNLRNTLLHSENLGWLVHNDDINTIGLNFFRDIKLYDNDATKDNISLIFDAVMRKHDISTYHKDQSIYSLTEELIEKNNYYKLLILDGSKNSPSN